VYKLGVIEESLENLDTLKTLQPYFFSQRIEKVPDDTSPIWHTNEYHIPEENVADLLPLLERQVKKTWYIHAFNDKVLIVILKNKSFQISLTKDDSWNEMIAYGRSMDVESDYLEHIPLHI
jgi:hypothetical protein